MDIRQSITQAALSASLLLTAANLPAAAESQVTPYGDYCRDCTIYGVCREPISPQEAVQSLRRHYEARGYRLGIVLHRGRFIEAEIFRNGRLADKVLFDRKTGRVRSMY